jgi:hypothetical protein
MKIINSILHLTRGPNITLCKHPLNVWADSNKKEENHAQIELSGSLPKDWASPYNATYNEESTRYFMCKTCDELRLLVVLNQAVL